MKRECELCGNEFETDNDLITICPECVAEAIMAREDERDDKE